MTYSVMTVFASLGLFLGMLIAVEVGRRIRVRWATHDLDSDRAFSGLLDGAVFGLLGLLIAFTFSGAASRFDHRRDLVMDEANAIGTAWLRLDLLPLEKQPALRELFRQYLDARLEIYEKLPDMEAAEAALQRANQLQGRIWSTSVDATGAASVAATTLLLGALNQMFDIATMRTATGRVMHPPIVIFVMVFGLAVISSVLAGYVMTDGGGRHWIHVTVFAAIIAITVYVILDIEFP
ncbi:MAG: bestrophin-like domain, partial [Gammaproteobacteria bacterium]